ncbi:YcnI family protein [uncultured Jatrophihabitans sp.]|uniref:YcnI family copper-binding membrane protein n=1 Tax=uncultured Jatrophihabitans sp. TaxID=1610747 RepID=UPI0035CC4331
MSRPVRLLALVLGACCALLAFAAGASAHVTITSPGAVRGGSDQEITFRVPVEKEFDTVKLTVTLPTATPIASVDVEPVPGWTHVQKVVKLAKPIVTDDGDITSAVSQVTWTAQSGQGLKPGEFGAFTIIAGLLPDVSKLVFPAVQTYSDGSVVNWNQVAAPGAKDEPEDPAPTLDLAPAAKSDSSSDASKATVSATASAAPAKSASNTGPVVLSIIALVLAAAALGLAVVGRARRSGRA